MFSHLAVQFLFSGRLPRPLGRDPIEPLQWTIIVGISGSLDGLGTVASPIRTLTV